MRDRGDMIPLRRKGVSGMTEFRPFKMQYVETSVGSEDVQFCVEPSSWLRRRVKSWYYFVGDEVRFRIGIKGNKKYRSMLGRLAVYEDLPRPQHWEALKQPHELKTNPYETAFRRGGEPPKFVQIVGSRIVERGMGRYTLGYPGSKDAEVIITFEAKPKEALLSAFLYFLSLVVSALLGGGVGGYLGYLLAGGNNGT